MKPKRLLRAILPDVLIDNFDIVNFDKSADRFDIYLDEKKVQLKEDKTNPDIISYGFGEYRTIQDYPIRGRATYLHVRKRKWLDKSSNEIFSYDWDLSEFDGTRLNSEFVSFLKKEIESTPVSICVLAERYGVKGQTLRKQYKEKISDYRNWDQLEHAHDYLLYPENIGENLSLDETCLSNGDVYTILTNKAAKGRKGALVAMVRGVATDAVSGILRRLPHRKRLSVKTVTTDLSSAMMLTVRKVFPAAKLINDRFHVQQLMSEAVDRLRIRYRWKVLDAENQAIREHRQKKKEAKSKAERERIGKWEPERMENGETLPQIVSRSKHIILKHWSKWNEQQKTRAAILFDKFPKLLEGYSLSMKLTDIFNKKSGPDEARLNLARWYNEVEKFDYMEFNKVLDTFSNHSTTIINYFEERLTNASAESFNAKIKAFRSQLRGVADLKFFMFRLARLYA
ncbi:transposase [Phocaeicola vulgatus]|nr:transposase [Phocaeicola vulgatus]